MCDSSNNFKCFVNLVCVEQSVRARCENVCKNGIFGLQNLARGGFERPDRKKNKLFGRKSALEAPRGFRKSTGDLDFERESAQRRRGKSA